MTLVATNVGGGILGLPYAYYHFGLINAIVINLVIAVLAHISAMVYLRVKSLTKRNSVYEIAYLLIGRKSIFIVCTGMLFAGLASMILYYVIIGDTAAHLWVQFFSTNARGTSDSSISDLKTGTNSDLQGQPWLV